MTAPVTSPAPSSPDARWLDGLPYRDFLELGAYETAPSAARGHLAGVLREWSLSQFEDVAALIVSELITNSVAETGKVAWSQRRPPVRVWLRAGPSILAILVWDAIVDPPVPRDAGQDDESDRGLGIYFPPEFGGKVTWAVIDTP